MTNVATLLIPTNCERRDFLKHTLDALELQSRRDFEVLLILKTNDFLLTKMARNYNTSLDINILTQKRSGLMEAYNEGINHAKGDVIIFLDDDAVPHRNFVAEHLSTYERSNVSGVSGEVIPANLRDGILRPLKGLSEIVPSYYEPDILREAGTKLWNCPLKGQEHYLAYISKAGYSKKNIYANPQRITDTLLCMAANMSVLSSAIRDFQIPVSFLKRGIAFEQIIGWHLWKNGQRMVFNPRAKVYHILHGQTMSRFLNIDLSSHATIEDELLFYYLLQMGENVSLMHRVTSMAFNLLVRIKISRNDWKYAIAGIKGILLGNIIGLTWIFSKRINGTYIPVQDALFR